MNCKEITTNYTNLHEGKVSDKLAHGFTWKNPDKNLANGFFQKSQLNELSQRLNPFLVQLSVLSGYKEKQINALVQLSVLSGYKEITTNYTNLHKRKIIAHRFARRSTDKNLANGFFQKSELAESSQWLNISHRITPNYTKNLANGWFSKLLKTEFSKRLSPFFAVLRLPSKELATVSGCS